MRGSAATRPGSRLPVRLLLTAALGASILAAAGCTPRKKLIEWGWDEPDTGFLRENLREMERTTPFDGCVFGVRLGREAGAGSFTWQFWGRRAFEERELAHAFDDLRGLRPGRFAANFLRVNVTPGDVDWFDDFSAVTANARLAARLARAARARGVVLDVEQYQGQPFDYRRQKLQARRPWAVYAAQARRRGGELMAAFQDGYPGLTLLLSFGHSLPWVQSEHGRRPLEECSYGLLAPFLDGVLERARGGTRVVDGYELSYGFRDPRQFDDARRLVELAVLPVVGAREAYRERLRLAFGIWLDFEWRTRGWSASEPAKNYHTPESFERVVAAALRTSDEFVWIYGENPRWWAAPTPGSRVPEAYAAALRRARAEPR